MVEFTGLPGLVAGPLGQDIFHTGFCNDLNDAPSRRQITHIGLFLGMLGCCRPVVGPVLEDKFHV